MKFENLKSYLVTFTFKIPVRATGDAKDISVAHENAYYKAKDKFYEYSLNEADCDITEIPEEEYNKRLNVEMRLHDEKWQ